MGTRISQSAVYAFVAIACAASPVAAQNAPGTAVVPYVAIGSANAAPAGVAVVVPITSTLSVETDVAYRQGANDHPALSTNATLLWSLPSVGRATPYLAGGVGLAQQELPLLTRGSVPVGLRSQLAVTVNAGGGVKVPINDRVALRTDARWFRSLGVSGSEQFRVAQGISVGVGKR
jgi:opacity protein-like surface antigen